MEGFPPALDRVRGILQPGLRYTPQEPGNARKSMERIAAQQRNCFHAR
jgi:hypothetical protein